MKLVNCKDRNKINEQIWNLTCRDFCDRLGHPLWKENQKIILLIWNIFNIQTTTHSYQQIILQTIKDNT